MGLYNNIYKFIEISNIFISYEYRKIYNRGMYKDRRADE